MAYQASVVASPSTWGAQAWIVKPQILFWNVIDVKPYVDIIKQKSTYFKCRNFTLFLLDTHSLTLSPRENRGWCGAGSPACGAVGWAYRRKECRAGASTWQWDPWGTGWLVSPPFPLCRPDKMVWSKSHTSNFPGLSQEMLSNMSCHRKATHLFSFCAAFPFCVPTTAHFLSQEAREHFLPG